METYECLFDEGDWADGTLYSCQQEASTRIHRRSMKSLRGAPANASHTDVKEHAANVVHLEDSVHRR